MRMGGAERGRTCAIGKISGASRIDTAGFLRTAPPAITLHRVATLNPTPTLAVGADVSRKRAGLLECVSLHVANQGHAAAETKLQINVVQVQLGRAFGN